MQKNRLLMNEELRMAELLCTRLCHDLTGPIGAVNNGAEFLSEDGFNMQNQAMQLIVSSAFSAVTRLQFYRIAYGRVKEHGEANLAERQKLALDFFTDTKISLDWPDSHTDSAGVSISLKMSRLIYNLLIIASSVLIRGGKITIRITMSEPTTKKVSLIIEGAGLKWDGDIDKIFKGEFSASELTPKTIQIYLSKLYADDLNATIDYTVSEERVELQVLQPISPNGL
ncbi:MAG: histidine phosphotransferase family protein [Rickettsiales bacterium]|nr:histidine phosphotransferase family protein [Rickettsiales bacterium]